MNIAEKKMEMTRQLHQHEYVCRGTFQRTGALSYIGHLDLKAVFERALRRTDLPMLYSQGFNPRPMIVFALPLGVGINTEGDYIDVSMEVPVEPDEFISKVNDKLPEGLKIISAVSIDEPKNSLMSVVSIAEYRIDAPGISEYLEKIFSLDKIETTKKSKGKEVSVDIKPLLISITDISEPDSAKYLCYAGSTQNLRPDVLLKAMTEILGYDKELAANATITRLKLYGGKYPDLASIEGLL
ncbi:MAG: TIGR03936 family radical SAM-associated protein [Saccharofermentans sp.]|nr:TIGR03936 family radical SAM-associated protein [Saccharofermentans sp.]